MSSRFIKGAMILSISMVISRILSLIYIIPFQRLVGSTGLALYGYAYVPYTFLITLSTLGIPLGVAKFVAKYNADREYDTSRKIFRLGMICMITLGILGFLIMWIGAPMFARLALSGSEDAHNTIEDVIVVIRTVSFAVIVVPPIALLRGYFQGNQDMNPTAISQLVEQFVRVTLIVAGAFVVIHTFDGSIQTAVKVSVFAAFVAGVSALFVLRRYWVKKKHSFDTLLTQTIPHPHREPRDLIKELVSYALPFALLSLVTTWFQVIDTMTFHSGIMRMSDSAVMGMGVEVMTSDLAQSIFGTYITALQKIIMIPVSFAIAFSQPLVPDITEKVQLGNTRGVHKTLSSALMLTSFVTLPAVVGMWLLSNPIYVMLFNEGEVMNQLGGSMFGVGAFVGIFMGMNAVMCAIMQGVNLQYKALLYLVVGSVIKLVGNLVLIPLLGGNGAVVSTMMAYAFCVVFNYLAIQKATGVATKRIMRQHLSIFVFTALMAFSVWATTLILNRFIDYNASSITAGAYVMITAIVGAAVYGGLSVYFGLVKVVLGARLASRFKRRQT